MPLVYNTSGYERVEALRLLEGIFRLPAIHNLSKTLRDGIEQVSFFSQKRPFVAFRHRALVVDFHAPRSFSSHLDLSGLPPRGHSETVRRKFLVFKD